VRARNGHVEFEAYVKNGRDYAKYWDPRLRYKDFNRYIKLKLIFILKLKVRSVPAH
jgi:hypothetical protein